MSLEELELEKQLLREKIDFLERELRRLYVALSLGWFSDLLDWEVVEEEQFCDQVPLLPRRRFALEEGPPELPSVCKRFALERLWFGKTLFEDRAEAAFKIGFWVWIAIETYIPFLDKHSIKELNPTVWVLFRGARYGCLVRLVRKSECIRMWRKMSKADHNSN